MIMAPVVSKPYLPVCLLCGSDSCVVHHSLTSDELLKCWALAGYVLNARVAEPLVNEAVISLYRCAECGFQFFNPQLAGSAEFYENLHASSSDYYASDRPENERNARFAVRHGLKKILDVGCGTGFALDTARRYGLETFGLE